MKQTNETEKIFLQLEKLQEESHHADAVFRAYLRGISRSFGVKRVSLMLIDETRKELFIHESEGLRPELKGSVRVRLGEGISGYVAESGEGVLVQDIEKNKTFRGQKKKKGFASKSFICIPLKVNGRVYGVLNISEKKNAKPFTPTELQHLELFGMQLALLVENQYLLKRLQWLEKKPVEEVAEISHDFRIPLTCLQEVINLMSGGEFGPISKTQQNFLDLANRSVNRMISTFDDLIAVATRVTHPGYKIEKVDLAATVRELGQQFEAKARSRKVTLKIDVPERCWMRTDGRKVSDVVMNLIDNAIKYTHAQTDVDVRLFQKDGIVRVEVRDKGPGISKEVQKTIFDKEANIRRTQESDLEDSHGLGLAMAYEVLQKLGGRLGLDSKSGKGSIFYLELPLQKKIRQAAREKKQLPDKSS